MAQNNSTNQTQFPPTSGIGVLSTTTGIDGTAIATTNLYTVPAGKTAYVTQVIVRITAISALVGVGTGGIGVAAGEDDIFSSRALTGMLNSATPYSFVNNNGIFASAAAASIIKLGIDIAFVAGSVTLAVDLIGYLS